MEKITEIVQGINQVVSENLSYAGNEFFNISDQHEKDEKSFILTRTDGSKGTIVINKSSQNLVFYHRILEEEINDLPYGKGADTAQLQKVTLRLVGYGQRQRIPKDQTKIDNQEYLTEVLQILNQTTTISGNEQITIEGHNSVFNEVNDEEFNGYIRKELRLEMVLFYIDYNIKRNIDCMSVDPVESTVKVNIGDFQGSVSFPANQAANIFVNLLDLNDDPYDPVSVTQSNVNFNVVSPVSSSEIVSVTISNDNQFFWSEETFKTMDITIDPCDGVVSYDQSNVPAGLSVWGNSLVITDFSLIPDGLNSFTIPWTGTGGFTGSGTLNVSITKEILWTPSVGLEAGTILYGFNADFGVTFNPSFPDLVQSWEDLYGPTGVAPSNNSSSQPLYTTNGEQNIINSLGNRQGVLLTLSSDVDINTTEFYSFFGGKINDSVQGTTMGTINNFFEIAQFFAANNSGGISTSVRIPRDTTGSVGANAFLSTDIAEHFTQKLVINTKISVNQWQLRINDELLVSATPNFANTVIPQQHQVAGYQNGGAVSTRFILGVTDPNQNDIDRITGWMSWDLGVESTLPVGHPYKSQPPFE